MLEAMLPCGKMNGLPEIAKVKQQNLAEGLASKINTQSPPSFFEDSGLELRGSSISRPSTAGSGRGWVAKSPSGSARFSPSPPPGLARPRSSLNTTRRSLEFVRMSKSELERTEETLNLLRSEVVEKQAQVRRLQHYEQDFTTLQSGCGKVAETLGCSVEGVAASAIPDILLTRVSSLVESNRLASQQRDEYSTELEQCRGELAAAKVQLATTQDHLKKTKKEGKHFESNLKQTRSELEMLQQTCARTGATVESLRQQLAETQGKVGKGQKEAEFELTQLQTDVGRLRKEMTEKDDVARGLGEQVSAMEEERNSLKERLSSSETMHAELCIQLALTLQLDSTESLDLDYLLSKVSGAMEECEELRLRCETLSRSIKTAELDSKASRETILRLVSEGKKHNRIKEELTKLQSEVDEHKAALVASEQDRVGLQERLMAAKETMVSLEHEIQAKEERLSELCRNADTCKLVSESTKSLVNTVQAKYDDLIYNLGVALSLHSTDSGDLLQAIQDLAQKCRKQSEELKGQCSLLSEREASIKSLQNSSGLIEHNLKKERSKLRQLEGEVVGEKVIREGLARDLDKWREFGRKVAKAVQLERGVAEILSGDFAHDAILMKAEQLAKQENEALLSKQTAVYSLQRKLKACQQTLQSRELHMSLLQKKTEGLQQSLKATNHREVEWEASVKKMKKMEKQLERLQDKVEQQRETISQLESNTNQLQQLKECCHQLEEEQARLIASKEELDHTCAKQSQQLAEVRQKAKQRHAKEDLEAENIRKKLESLQAETKKLEEREEKSLVFKTAIQRLLLSYHEDLAEKESTLSDYDLIATLESLIGSQKRHRDNAKCLEASLRQLELGFKTSYKDTLTILSSD